MNTKLTLQEKLRDLRAERKLTLAELAKSTGISKTVLHRLETHTKERINYQDVVTLIHFYKISADYLFGLTDNRQHRGDGLDALYLPDEAIVALQSGDLNNRLLGEVIAHPDFPYLLAALEAFVDRTTAQYLDVINKVYQMQLDMIARKNIPVNKRDEYVTALTQMQIEPDEYYSYHLSKRFEKLARSLCVEHEKETLPKSGQSLIKSVEKQLRKLYGVEIETVNTDQVRLEMIADQLDVDLNETTEEEKRSLLSFLNKSFLGRLFMKP
jgi:transcriptional regulator with XRE-family HTH domain